MTMTNWVMLGLAALVATGCAHPEPGAMSTDNEYGTLELGLSAAAGNGRRYELRDAEFVIRSEYGADAGNLVTETNPNADRLSIKLLPGSYRVSLQAGWSMFDVTETLVVPVTALLLSPAEQDVFIQRFALRSLTYQFGVDGDPIDFGGTLGINISVVLPERDGDAGH